MRQRTVKVCARMAYSWKEKKLWRIAKRENGLDEQFYVPVDRETYSTKMLIGWLFVPENKGIIDLFERISSSKYPEWRKESFICPLKDSEERAVIERGNKILSNWTDLYDGLWDPRRKKMKTSKPMNWVRSVLSSKWWNERCQIKEILICPHEAILYKAIALRGEMQRIWTNDIFDIADGKKCIRKAIPLLREELTEINLALSLLKTNGEVSTSRLRAFGNHFWGKERTEAIMSGI